MVQGVVLLVVDARRVLLFAGDVWGVALFVVVVPVVVLLARRTVLLAVVWSAVLFVVAGQIVVLFVVDIWSVVSFVVVLALDVKVEQKTHSQMSLREILLIWSDISREATLAHCLTLHLPPPHSPSASPSSSFFSV